MIKQKENEICTKREKSKLKIREYKHSSNGIHKLVQ